MEEKEYIVYRCPDGKILLDWNETLWKYGYPCWPKHKCVELERGMCIGGPYLPRLYAEMEQKYCTQRSCSKMTIQKGNRTNNIRQWNGKPIEAYMRRSHNNLWFSSTLRDYILPKRYVSVDVTKDGIVLMPCDDESTYKVSLSNNQASISGCVIAGTVEIKQGIRYPAKLLDDGSILIYTKPNLER